MSNDYNYTRFKPEAYNFDHFDGLEAGDQFIDAEVYTLDGDPVKVSDYLDKQLVLETGSMTCPMYAQSTPPMQDYAKQFRNLNFIVLYVREAHPGEITPAHKSVAHKIKVAERSNKAHGEYRRVVVDKVTGDAHKVYGAMPNSIYIIDTDGKVLFRSIWNNADQIGDVLQKISDNQIVTSGDMKAIPPFSFKGVKTLLMGGGVAFFDFIFGLPKLIGMHKKAGNM